MNERDRINTLLATAISIDQDEALKCMLVTLFTLDILRNATTTIELRREPGADELFYIQRSLSQQVGEFLNHEGYIRWKLDGKRLSATATLLRKPE